MVIAGGAGFIGSHLSESLLNSGVDVIGLDDLATGSMANITSFRRHPHYEFIECNVNQKIPDAILERPITHVVHAMGLDTHSSTKNATLASLLTGSFGTKNLLDISVKKGATFLLLSTVNIYEGMASSTSLNHYYGSTENQQAEYSHVEAKRYAEGLCQMYADEYNLDVRVARLSEIYGPRMDVCDNTFLDTMLQQTLNGSDLIVHDDGNQEIYLTYVDDAIYGISKLLFAEGEQFRRSIYALVSSEKTSVISVAYTLRTFLPPGKEIKFMPQTHKPDFQLPKISFDRAKRDLDWEPSVNITDGLKLTVESFQKGSSQQLRQHLVERELLATTTPAVDPVRPAAAVQLISNTNKKANPPAPAEPIPLLATDNSESTNKLPFRGKPDPTALKVAKAAVPTPVSKDTANLSAAQNKKSSSAKEPEVKNAVKVRKRPASWWKRLIFAAILVGLYISLGRPVLHTLSYTLAGGLALQQGKSAIESLDFQASATHFTQARDKFNQAHQSVKGLAWPASVIGLGSSQREAEHGLAALTAVADGLTTLSVAGQPWPEQLHALLQFHHPSSSPVDIQALVDQSKIGLQQSQQQFSLASGVLSGSGSTKVAGAALASGQETIGEAGLFAGFLQSARTLLAQTQSTLAQASQALDVLPQVLGAHGKRTYLVAFQNSNELRPTGGFIGSYALIQVDQGRISAFKIDDIYNPDGQLHTDIPAPAPLQQELGVGQLFIRDANWSPDAITSGQQVAELYQAATKESVDGVIFITTKAIKPLLANLGPLHLENFNETVTADNFSMLAQTHSNVGFVPGSTGKKDFLSVLAETLLARIEQGNSGDWLQAGQALAQGLSQREIQIYVKDPAVALLIDQQDWSGRTKVTNGDYLRVVDANIGANKSNYYITRQTDYSINVDRNSHLTGVAKISWQHAGTSGTWPGGSYRNYVRLYVPLGTTLISASNFDVENLDVFTEGDKQVFGGYVTVPYDSQKTVEVAYTLPSRLGLLENNGNYNLLWQKQSGIVDEKLSVAFNPPVFLNTTQISTGGETKDGRIIWRQKGSNDLTFSAQLQQN